MQSTSESLTTLWHDTLRAIPSLHRHIPTLVDEDLTPALVKSMKNLGEALAELGLDAADSEALREALAHPTSAAIAQAVDITEPPPPPARATDDPTVALCSPPRGWPETANKATDFVSKQLRGTKMRMVGALGSQHAAPLVELTLKPSDARGNADRVRDRTGWAVLAGYALMERDDSRTATAALHDGWLASACGRYIGVPHYWNATPRGLWLDATPRPHAHLQQLVLVESNKVAVPPPPYEAKSHSPMVIVACEGLCNRLRAVTSYRQIAHEDGRPLVVVWRRDDCARPPDRSGACALSSEAARRATSLTMPAS